MGRYRVPESGLLLQLEFRARTNESTKLRGWPLTGPVTSSLFSCETPDTITSGDRSPAWELSYEPYALPGPRGLGAF